MGHNYDYLPDGWIKVYFILIFCLFIGPTIKYEVFKIEEVKKRQLEDQQLVCFNLLLTIRFPKLIL